MKIQQWDVTDDPLDKGGVIVIVTKQEAIKLIHSLSHQLDSGDYNDKRLEFFNNEGKTFSIAINEDKDALFRGEKVGDIN